MPKPIWVGLRPPREAVGPEPACSISEIWSWKVTRLPLKPVVLTLARLLATTSI